MSSLDKRRSKNLNERFSSNDVRSGTNGSFRVEEASTSSEGFAQDSTSRDSLQVPFLNPHMRTKSADMMRLAGSYMQSSPRKNMNIVDHRNVSTDGDFAFIPRTPPNNRNLSPLQTDFAANGKKRLIDQFFSPLSESGSKTSVADSRKINHYKEESKIGTQNESGLRPKSVYSRFTNSFNFTEPQELVQWDELLINYLSSVDSIFKRNKDFKDRSFIDPMLCISGSLSDTLYSHSAEEVASSSSSSWNVQLKDLCDQLNSAHDELESMATDLRERVSQLDLIYSENINVKISKLDKLLSNIASLEKRLEDIKLIRNKCRSILDSDLQDKLSYLENVSEKINEHISSKRASHIRIFILVLSCLVLAAALYFTI